MSIHFLLSLYLCAIANLYLFTAVYIQNLNFRKILYYVNIYRPIPVVIQSKAMVTIAWYLKSQVQIPPMLWIYRRLTGCLCFLELQKRGFGHLGSFSNSHKTLAATCTVLTLLSARLFTPTPATNSNVVISAVLITPWQPKYILYIAI